MNSSKLIRSESGRFVQKSAQPRKVRSIRLTDTTWETLGQLASSRGITRADLIEHLLEGGVISQDSLSLLDATYQQILSQLEQAMKTILADPSFTRKGKDSGALRRGLLALIQSLKPTV